MMEVYLKLCEIMMSMDRVDIPESIIKEKYICFEQADEVSLQFAAVLEKKTKKVPLFYRKDIEKSGLGYRACESIGGQEEILSIQKDWEIFNRIGIYNEQCALLEEIRRLRAENANILVVDVPDWKDLARELTEDLESEFVHVVNGMRATTDAPAGYENYIRFLGPCVIGGMFSKDEGTIPSVVQRLVNEEYPNKYLVLNHGTCGFYRSYLEKMERFPVMRGDLLVFMDKFHDIKECKEELCAEIDMELFDVYNGTEKDLFFDECIHMAEKGNREVGKYIYRRISDICRGMAEEKESRAVIRKAGKIYAKKGDAIAAGRYRKEAEALEEKYKLSEKKNGAIVMNCNPYTEGHKYLIDTARKYVDNLLVFVVEEDKSLFPFEDRKKMVELGTGSFRNVIVLSSGRLILSNLTMPEYFQKESLQGVRVYPAKDVEIFARQIAPAYHIAYRFVGEEPIDRVTAQYNRAIKEICPQYGIQVVEIPRKEKDGKAISASRVRKLLAEGKYEEIKGLVPESTYQYIGALIASGFNL